MHHFCMLQSRRTYYFRLKDGASCVVYNIDSKLRIADIDLPPLRCFCALTVASYTGIYVESCPSAAYPTARMSRCLGTCCADDILHRLVWCSVHRAPQRGGVDERVRGGRRRQVRVPLVHRRALAADGAVRLSRRHGGASRIRRYGQPVLGGRRRRRPLPNRYVCGSLDIMIHITTLCLKKRQ